MEEKYHLSQRAVAEMLGTALLVLVGPGSVVATLALPIEAVKRLTASFVVMG